MKELSVEEKATRYDDAIKKAKSLYEVSEPLSGCNVIIETIFPELKESEDERIRKELITHCRNTRCVTEEGAEKIAKWIAWLEKQGEQKPDWSNNEKLMLADIIEATERSNIFMWYYKRELVDWLKFLKQRIGGKL